ncbi:hypothetical protein HRbin02_00002 [Candidatus Calditenuaceae archaeon HR02]|nr:hypothetical protein HRbin02_00002 [Candidatus Calditenuaceae archaeon HR02]
MVKHVLVTLTDEQYQCISQLKGKMGNSDAEVLRNIFLAWISEKTGMGCWRETSGKVEQTV